MARTARRRTARRKPLTLRAELARRRRQARTQARTALGTFKRGRRR